MKVIQSIGFYVFVSSLLFSCKQDSRVTELAVKSISKVNNTEVKSNSQEIDFNTMNYFLPKSTTNQIISHDYYTLSYSEKYEQAEWVAYVLNSNNNNSNIHFKRPFFIQDPKVKTNSADWKNYKNSGYDKGHLCPAGDMKISKKSFEETFYTSNISPQIHEFNDGVWNKLEQKARYWSTKYNGLYVVTGGVLNNNLKKIGKEGVAVPKYFYKVLLKQNAGSYNMIAFLIPNLKSEKPLYEFVISVDELEKRTGIDFFPNLEDKLEIELEKNSNYKEWNFN